jgi:flagellar basal-body rod protein FlgG
VTAQIDFNSVRTIATGFPLDLALLGPGFFQVSDAEGNRFYTRRGRFCVGSGGKIVMREGDRELFLFPEISIPNGTGDVIVHHNGEVEITASNAHVTTLGHIQLSLVLNPDDLLDGPNGLFRIPPECAARLVLTSPGTLGAGQISQRMLETPVVDIAAERQAIEVLEALKEFP